MCCCPTTLSRCPRSCWGIYHTVTREFLFCAGRNACHAFISQPVKAFSTLKPSLNLWPPRWCSSLETDSNPSVINSLFIITIVVCSLAREFHAMWTYFLTDSHTWLVECLTLQDLAPLSFWCCGTSWRIVTCWWQWKSISVSMKVENLPWIVCWRQIVATVEQHLESPVVSMPHSIQTYLRKLLRTLNDATTYINDSDFAQTVN